MVKYLDNNTNSGFNMWRANNATNKTSKRSWFTSFLWWTAIFVAVWWLIGVWMRPAPVASDTPATVPVDVSAVPVGRIMSDDVSYDVRGLRIENVELAQYMMSGDDAAHVKLLDDAEKSFIEIGMISPNTTAPSATTVWAVNAPERMTWRAPDGIEFTRAFSTDGYLITVTDTVRNTTAAPISVSPYVRIVRGEHNNVTGGVHAGGIVMANNDIEYRDWRKLDKKSYAYTTTTGFVGFADQYWETVASIDASDQTLRVKKNADEYQADASAAAITIAPGKDATITTRIFAGPRDQSALNAAAPVIVGINRTVDYGWFWFLARPMLWILNAINAVVMNYGIAIIVMTILLRLLMWPLTRKSYTSMAAMQKMQPEMARIQKLYAGDKMRMQMEMMRLYREHKTSPMSGCLPMLLQIPIFFALYKALLISVPMRGAHFLWIRDLAAMDPYFILPILMGVTMWWQTRLQSASRGAATGDAAAAMRFMKWMPVLFVILFAWMPAGLVLYWTVSNLFGILQMEIIKRRMDRK